MLQKLAHKLFENRFPLSFSQQRFWFLDQLLPKSGLFNVPLALRLRGHLDLIALENAFTSLLNRHEILRTQFFCGYDGNPYQIVNPVKALKIEIEDLSKFDPLLQETIAQEKAEVEAAKSFDLSNDDLIRVKLLQLNTQDNILLITFHHIITDAWSTGIFFKELASYYEGWTKGKEIQLGKLPIQYKDFALLQRERLQEERFETQLKFWKKKMSGSSELLTLPTDRPRPKEISYQGGGYRYQLSSALTKKLKGFRQEVKCTAFMVHTAAYYLLLKFLSGQQDVVIGTPFANRQYQNVGELLGLFVNILPLRINLDESKTFKEVLACVRQEFLEILRNTDIPFEQLVEQLKVQRELSRNPIFQVMIVVGEVEEIPVSMGALDNSFYRTNTKFSRYDLSLYVSEQKELTNIEIEYSKDLFDEKTIAQMARYYEQCLEVMVSQPDKRLREFSLLKEEEKDQQLIGWNDTRVEYANQEETIPSLIEKQAEKTPDAIALMFEGEQLSYRALNTRANQLTRYLQEQGVGVESLVGICLERSLDMVVSILAVHKAGGAYVPLDPSYPKDRLSYMLSDISSQLVISHSDVVGCIEEYKGKSILVDRMEDQLIRFSPENLDTKPSSSYMAYVIYTSGSTGQPKGVMVDQAGLVNRLCWMDNEYVLKPSDSVLHKTPFSFDVAGWELLWPLISGAKMVIASPDLHRDAEALVDLINSRGVTILHFVPSMLQYFLSELEKGRTVSSLRSVFTSGEALAYETVEKFYQLVDSELHNLYGPTEASIDVSYWDSEKYKDYNCIPIGKPIWNTQLYILDAYGRLVPQGVIG
ncbi:MAG: AMP-binding protein, partial [Alphaproteobacteria bacterium]|nr:AMP-binding protein [Alphaproteobacteria bacterium]